VDGATTTNHEPCSYHAFIEQYAAVSQCDRRSQPAEAPARPTSRAPAVSAHELDTAIAALVNGKAPGPDGIHAEMLKHLGPLAKSAIRDILDRCFQTARTPEAFRQALIVPLLKAGKDPTAPSSYRPVALTSVLAKLAERVTLKRMTHFIHVPDTQFGFRSQRSTEDAVQVLLSRGHQATAKSKVMVAVLIDFSKAFDMVDHRRLLSKLHKMGLPDYLTGWIGGFLYNRVGRVRVGAKESHNMTMTCGVPQGTILGPILFNLYTADLLESLIKSAPSAPARERLLDQMHPVHSVAYADDLTIFKTARNACDTTHALQRALNKVDAWAEENFMQVNASKTVYVIFGGASKSTVHLTLKGTTIEADPYARLLGVHLDPKLSMNNHARKTIGEAAKRVSALSRIAARRFGPHTADLRSFLIGFVRSKLLYGSSCAFGSMSATNKEALERVQRGAARIATGLCSSSSDASALLEARLTPLHITAKLRELHLLERAERTAPPHLRPRDEDDAAVADRGLPRPSYFESDLLAHAVRANPELNHARALRLRVFDRLGMNPLCPRLPRRRAPCYAPWETGKLNTILRQVVTDSEGNPLGSSAEADTKRAGSMATLRGLAVEFAPDLLVATDGSAIRSKRTSGAAAVFYPPSALDAESEEQLPEPLLKIVRPAGAAACSFRTEAIAAIAVLQALRGMRSWERPRRVLIATDSLSLVQALGAGPLADNDANLQTLWNQLYKLAARGTQVAFQFVFSHCGVPINEAADKAADEGNKLDQSTVPMWLPDFMSAAKELLLEEWHASIREDDPRKAALGHTKMSPCKTVDGVSRADEVLLAQLRTGECPLFGRLAHRLGASSVEACRWCSPELHTAKASWSAKIRAAGAQTADEHRRMQRAFELATTFDPERARALEDRRRVAPPRGATEAPVTPTASLREALTAAPPAQRSRTEAPQAPTTSDFPCQHCGRYFQSSRGRATHHRFCTQRLGEPAPALNPPNPASLPPLLPTPPEPAPAATAAAAAAEQLAKFKELYDASTCPKCRLTSANKQALSKHMGRCCPEVRDALRKPKYDTYNLRAAPTPALATAARETVLHVLFRCPALSADRPGALKTDDPLAQARALFDPVTAAFARLAHDKLPKASRVKAPPSAQARLALLAREVARSRVKTRANTPTPKPDLHAPAPAPVAFDDDDTSEFDHAERCEHEWSEPHEAEHTQFIHTHFADDGPRPQRTVLFRTAAPQAETAPAPPLSEPEIDDPECFEDVWPPHDTEAMHTQFIHIPHAGGCLSSGPRPARTTLFRSAAARS
jgi:ribonuclease HI/ssDNA-binding Zn-finger/Zn-ribbon topoisomerase 1